MAKLTAANPSDKISVEISILKTAHKNGGEIPRRSIAILYSIVVLI